MRTAQTIEAAANSDSTVTAKRKRPESATRGLRPWKPGQSGNPGGRKKPQVDVAAEISRAIFNENPEVIYAAFGAALKKGNAYAFQVLADRAFGKLKESLNVSMDEDLVARLAAGRARAAKK